MVSEYTVICLEDGGKGTRIEGEKVNVCQKAATVLNSLSAQGWEVVTHSSLGVGNWTSYVLKRAPQGSSEHRL